MSLPVPLNATGLRSRLLFHLMHPRLRPCLSQHALLCAHGQPRIFDIDHGSARFSDVYARVNCLQKGTVPQCRTCAESDPNSDGLQAFTWLTNQSEEYRAYNTAILQSLEDSLNDDQKSALLTIIEENLGVVPGARELRLYLFLEPDVPAIVDRLVVPDTSRFSFRDSSLFELSNAGSSPPVFYERYELTTDTFKMDSGVLDTIDVSKRGDVLIYRRTGIQNWECPNLFELRMELQEKHYGIPADSSLTPLQNDILHELTQAVNESVFTIRCPARRKAWVQEHILPLLAESFNLRITRSSSSLENQIGALAGSYYILTFDQDGCLMINVEDPAHNPRLINPTKVSQQLTVAVCNLVELSS
ncbi:hypothetical protein C8R46DRAFT_1036060 [Mycena filopes]|nr:hypothetical protein C8R46DRAFT_1036060 [Mycena filopes]